MALMSHDEEHEMLHRIETDPGFVENKEFTRDDAKKLYVLLRHEQQRSEVYQTNLSRKMQKIKADLDLRTEEVETLQRTLKLEQEAHLDESTSMMRERDFKNHAQEERIRDSLGELLYSKPSSAGNATYDLDTVMVSYIKPGNFRYNLAFRIDNYTAVQELRESACRYWGISADEYVLKTMASNKCQDELLVKECFKQGEIAQLRLQEKGRAPSEKPTDDELKAIQPKVKNKKKQQRDPRYDAVGVNGIQKQQENHATELKKMGGSYFLLKTPMGKPSEHMAKTKLRDIIIYSVLLALTVYAYTQKRPVGVEFWLTAGFTSQLRMSHPINATYSAPDFDNVTSSEELWQWLTYSLPSILYTTNTSDSLGSHNLLMGYMAIRVQNVKEPKTPDEYCMFNKQVVNSLASDGAACYPSDITPSTQETREFVTLKTYWDKELKAQSFEELGSRLRGPTPPWMWASADQNKKDHNIRSVSGVVSTYDASGYTVEYNMQADDKVEAYRKDLEMFRRSGWISDLTRVVIISFTAYNYDLDMWVSTDVVFELTPSGSCRNTLLVLPFRPTVLETRAEQQAAYVDYTRLIIAFYIGIFVGISERHHKIKNHKAGCLYHISLAGICDLGIVGCLLAGAIWTNTVLTSKSTKEYMIQATDPTGTLGFQSFSWIAWTYSNVLCIEGLLMLFLFNRVISFLRLNRSIYLLWHTMGNAVKPFLFFVLMFLPTFIGVVLIMHRIYGPYLDNYASIPGALLQLYKLLDGDMNIEELLQLDMVWAMFIILIFYVVVQFVLLNAFVAIVVDSYYHVMVTTQGATETWSSTRRLRWVLPTTLVNILQSLVPTSSAETS
mmetsp:Transcript_89361/g.255944  ORF Transcript_89361/g.255944 Transcript_89361/m.255944 type:complete len:839 (-) Transcript_89361:61-2577(-)